MNYTALARKLRPLIEKAAASLTDTDAVDAVQLFPFWHKGESYTADFRLQYGGKLYRVIQPHISQKGWEPDVTPALFAEIAAPGEIPVWKQPAGAHDAYMTGDQVHYPAAEDPVYESTVDSNVWAPDVYGWKLKE